MGLSSYNLPDASSFVYVKDLNSCQLDQESYHHLKNVLRIKDKEYAIISDGKGKWRLCESNLLKTEPNKSDLIPISEICSINTEHHNISIGFSITKTSNSELCVQKLTELGIKNIVPFISDRTTIKLNGQTEIKLHSRFLKIAKSAGEQSRNPYLPNISSITTFKQIVSDLGTKVAIMDKQGKSLTSELIATKDILLIGPEGGFSQKELEKVKDKFTLGQTVLRSETATIATAALVNYLIS